MDTRIGILSFAHLHAEGYQANLKGISGVDLVGFSHGNPDEGRRFAEEYRLRWFPGHQELLAQGLDAVLVCAENANHRALVENAAAAKCHILCEKPIGTNLADAEAMKRVCELNGVRFMTAFPMRFAPSAQAVQAMIKRGELGSILGVNGINHSEIPSGHRPWFADKNLAGGRSWIIRCTWWICFAGISKPRSWRFMPRWTIFFVQMNWVWTLRA